MSWNLKALRRLSFTWVCGAAIGGLVCVSGGMTAEEPGAGKPAEAAKPAASDETAKPMAAAKFMRLRKNERGESIAFETPVIRFTGDPQQRPGVTIDLIGAVHVGDKAYYDALNKLFTEYDVVLYELVAPEGTRVPKNGRGSGSGHPVGALQNGLKSLLDLEHQLECVDYTVDNLVHADMSPDEFSQKMKERNDGWLQMALRMMGQSAALQGQASAKNGKSGAVAPETQILLAFFSKDRNLKLKRAMAESLSQSEGGLAALEGHDGGSTIVTERNKKALEVLTKQLAAGKKKIGIFYGAAHLPDFEKRLVSEFQLQRGDERWLTAWALGGGK